MRDDEERRRLTDVVEAAETEASRWEAVARELERFLAGAL